jgi:UDP-N-acetylmuramoyl-L-alanyl-D-glutamate--2,6-diaminopimelate ligase
MAILAAMEEGARGVPSDSRAEVIVEADRRVAIRLAVQMATPDDVVAVAGKGHERTQETAEGFTPFDDSAELAAAIDVVVRAS